jgi:hypothetical protein
MKLTRTRLRCWLFGHQFRESGVLDIQPDGFNLVAIAYGDCKHCEGAYAAMHCEDTPADKAWASWKLQVILDKTELLLPERLLA